MRNIQMVMRWKDEGKRELSYKDAPHQKNIHVFTLQFMEAIVWAEEDYKLWQYMSLRQISDEHTTEKIVNFRYIHKI